MSHEDDAEWYISRYIHHYYTPNLQDAINLVGEENKENIPSPPTELEETGYTNIEEIVQKPHEMTFFYVKAGRKYYKVVEYGDFHSNAAVFITRTRKWYTIELASAEEAKTASDVRDENALMIYNKERPCPSRTIEIAELKSLLELNIGRAPILIVPEKPRKPPRVAPQFSYLARDLKRIADAPALLGIYNGPPSKPRSLFKTRPRCWTSFNAAIEILKPLLLLKWP